MPNPSLCAVAFLRCHRAEDHAWIELVRSESDPVTQGVIAPHFTLVFPTGALAPEAFEKEVRRHASTLDGPIDLTLRSAMVMPPFSPGSPWNLFLVPERGFSSLTQLHDRLYSGLLKSELRLDIPFIPHVTVGAFARGEDCHALASAMNERPLAIDVVLEALTIVEDRGTSVVLGATVPFG